METQTSRSPVSSSTPKSSSSLVHRREVFSKTYVTGRTQTPEPPIRLSCSTAEYRRSWGRMMPMAYMPDSEPRGGITVEMVGPSIPRRSVPAPSRLATSPGDEPLTLAMRLHCFDPTRWASMRSRSSRASVRSRMPRSLLSQSACRLPTSCIVEFSTVPPSTSLRRFSLSVTPDETRSTMQSAVPICVDASRAPSMATSS
mmetsp:Transcript_5744/g.17109  ORF Transcript_5744/g.17109 Transcript_5744/m.17109 type:complete len:200 (+) Transcript_5744:1301-1900(+)